MRRIRALAACSVVVACACGAILLVAGPGALPARAEEEPLGVRVTRGVERGVAFLRTHQGADGSFPGQWAKEYPVGHTALALYALAKSQVDPTEPGMRQATERVRARPLATTYETAVAILAFDALEDPALDDWIRVAARWLEQRSDLKTGLSSYPQPSVVPRPSAVAAWLTVARAARSRARSFGDRQINCVAASFGFGPSRRAA